MTDLSDLEALAKRIPYGLETRERVARHGLKAFFRTFWPYAYPGIEFKREAGWYSDVIADHLTAVSARTLGDLVINAPPGTGKSTLVSVMWQPWLWTLDPAHSFWFTSYSDENVQIWSERSATIMTSELYRAAWPEVAFTLGSRWKYQTNRRGGVRISSSLGGQVTGKHVRTMVCDDPHNLTEVESKIKKANAIRAWHGALATRTADPSDFRRVVNQQRTADDDLSATCLAMGYAHCCLPLRWHPKVTWDLGATLVKGPNKGEKFEWTDPRTTPGEPIDGNEEDAKAREKRLVNPRDRAAQFDQNPTPATGGIIERKWLKRWTWEILGDLDTLQWFQSWDFGFKGKDVGHSRVVGGLFAVRAPRVFLIDCSKPEHIAYYASKKRFLEMQSRPHWGRAKLKLIEDKANGTAIMSDLAEEVFGMCPVEPHGTKEERLIRHSADVRAGAFYLPPEDELPFVEELVNELVGFPRMAYDDFVDIVTQAFDNAQHPGVSWGDDWAAVNEALGQG